MGRDFRKGKAPLSSTFPFSLIREGGKGDK
jgi:hypothetical protein